MASMQQIFLDSSGGGNRLANYFILYGSNAYGFQAYLSLVDNVQLRKCLSRFRCSNHCLEIETSRRTKPLKTPICERLCKQCSLGAVEDEDHFLLHLYRSWYHVRINLLLLGLSNSVSKSGHSSHVRLMGLSGPRTSVKL
jgi:hypothetical protein